MLLPIQVECYSEHVYVVINRHGNFYSDGNNIRLSTVNIRAIRCELANEFETFPDYVHFIDEKELYITDDIKSYDGIVTHIIISLSRLAFKKYKDENKTLIRNTKIDRLLNS